MTDPATLLTLAERCEQAAGPDRELDQDITKLRVPNTATHIHRSRRAWSFFVYDSGKGIEWLENQPYTASLDAAVTLVPERWAVELVQALSGSPWHVTLRGGSALVPIIGATASKPALALCAAALRARAAMAQPSSDT
jgi:hypothetical protein